MPKRVQMTRNKPWRVENPSAVVVSRPTKWGNPFKIGEGPLDAIGAVGMFEDMLSDPEMLERHNYPQDLSELRGEDLACWCPLDQPCHADVLLKIANE